jgi:hypothetical protein
VVDAPDHLRRDDVVVADQCTNAQITVGVVDVVETREAVDVDEHLGEREPELHHRDKALPAGEHLRLVTAFGEDRKHLVDGRRSDVVEPGRVHGSPLLRCDGVRGRRYMRAQ